MVGRVGSRRWKGRLVGGGCRTVCRRKPRIGPTGIIPQWVEMIVISLTICGCKYFEFLNKI
jgi:hypothetical protein